MVLFKFSFIEDEDGKLQMFQGLRTKRAEVICAEYLLYDTAYKIRPRVEL